MTELKLPELLSWQSELWTEHHLAVKTDRLAHALFLIGSEGIGKKHYAINLAAKMLCSQSSSSEGVGSQESVSEETFSKLHACGVCHSCQLLDAVLSRDGVHPDLHIIAPEKQGSFIKVDQIRALDGVVRKSAQLSGYRVIIIESANRLNINAANALLKNLEEPGQRTLFLLVADSYAGVLPTIRSRCQVVNMPQPQHEQSIEWLRTQELSKVQAEEAICVLGNRPLLIESLAQSQKLDALIKVVPQLAALVSQRIDSVTLAESWGELPKAHLLLVLQNALHRLATQLLSTNIGESESVLEQSDNILLERLDIKQLCYLQQSVERMANLLNSSANPNQSLLLIDWLQQFQSIKQINIEENIQWR